MRTRAWAAGAAASALLLAACGGDDDDGGPNTDSGGERPDEIVLGLVPSQEVDQLVEDAEVLGELLGEELGIPVKTRVSESYTALVIAMQSGQAHVGMFGPVALVQAADQAGANVTLQAVRYGTSTYHTQWFTNNPDRFCETEVVEVENEDGSIYKFCNGTDEAETGPVGEEALANIEEGETIFFVDEGSASGYYYPATQIQEAADIDPLTGVDAQFAGSHQATVQGVQRGDAEVGVSFDDARDDLVEEDPEVGEDVVVFAWSEEIPNDGVAVSSELPQDLQDDITQAFVDVMDTKKGAKAFDAVYSIEGLVPADLDALDAAREVEKNFGDAG